MNDDTVVCSLFDSDPDIIGEMAFLLDKQKLGLKGWADLAAKLSVSRTTFMSFETCSTDNPTEQLFDILKVHFPRLTVGKLIDHLDAINRRDVILAIKKSTKGLFLSFIFPICVIIIENHLMTGPLGNSEFCFPQTSVILGRFSGNKIHCSPRDQSLSVEY